MLKFDLNGDCFASLSENQVVKVIPCLTNFFLFSVNNQSPH